MPRISRKSRNFLFGQKLQCRCSSPLGHAGYSKKHGLLFSAILSFTASSGTIWPYGIEFVTVPSGEFQMGQSVGSGWDELPIHRVVISRAFQMGKYEITQKQFATVMLTNPSYHKGDDLPVENVSWEDAQQFVTQMTANLKDGYQYRLATEAEWEYACRAGTTGNIPYNLDEYAWYSGNSGGNTHTVGTKKPNPFGLYDILGNVEEWVQDWYDENYYKYCVDHGIVTDPPGPTSGTHRVYRGGGYESDGNYIMPGFRSSSGTGFSGSSEQRGFRIVRIKKTIASSPEW